jgi:heme/copper-type cytochrome/quinol oxidase subunit 2
VFYKTSGSLIRFYGLAILLAVTWSTVAWSCPNCKDTLANDPAQAGLVRGFFWSIMFMVSMPFLVFGGISAYFYWEVRRARLASQAAVANTSVSGTSNLTSVDSPFAEPSSHVDIEEPVGAN